MAKAKKKSKQSSGRDPASAMLAIDAANIEGKTGLLDASLAEACLASHNKEIGEGRVFTANETISQLICLPMPSLAPRFLFQGDGFPMSRFILIDGFEETCKSALMHEIGRWHRLQMGSYIVIETEEKDGTELRDSFFNYDRTAWYLAKAGSQEAWNRMFFWWVERLQNIMDGYTLEAKESPTGKSQKFKPQGRVAPMCIGVDSISAVLIEKFVNDMLESGTPDRNFPIHAKLLSDFMKVGPKQLAQYPISFIAVSHLREQPVEGKPYLPKQRITTGGAAPKFQMTTEIEMRRPGKKQNTREDPKYGVIHSIALDMQIRKNSLAGKESVGVEMAWVFDPDDRDPLTGHKRQKTYFDWHSASIELIVDCSKGGAESALGTNMASELRGVIDLHADVNQRRVWSKSLGISETAKVSYLEAGLELEKKIQAEPDFRRQLYEILGIRPRRLFVPGIDIREQIAAYHNDLAKASEQAAADLTKTASSEVPLPVDPDAGTHA